MMRKHISAVYEQVVIRHRSLIAPRLITAYPLEARYD